MKIEMKMKGGLNFHLSIMNCFWHLVTDGGKVGLKSVKGPSLPSSSSDNQVQ